jgi:O-antigen/teichoic acid export membrane protein
VRQALKNLLNYPGIRKLTDSTLVRNTTWMFLGQGVRNVLRACYFLLIPRFLGTEQYGAFIAVTALIAIVAPFASFGIGYVLVKNVARDRNLFAPYWGNTLLVTLVSGLILVSASIVLVPHLLPSSISWTLIVMVAFADLLFTRLLDNACLAFQAFEMLGDTAKLNVLSGLLRLIAAVLLVTVVHHSSAVAWGVCYVLAAAVSCTIGLVSVHRKLGSPALAFNRIRPELAESFYFSVSLSSQTIYNDLDKTMVASISTLDAAGIYGAAYRLIEVAILPVRSLLSATYAAFFRHGTKGVSATARYASTLLPKAIGYSLFTSLVLFFAAPILPYLIGHEYSRSVEALRWLSPLPVLKTLHSFAADALTGAGRQGTRTAAQVVIAALNGVANLWLIRDYSWRGAAWSSLACDGLLVVGLWGLLLWFVRNESEHVDVPVPVPELVTSNE